MQHFKSFAAQNSARQIKGNSTITVNYLSIIEMHAKISIITFTNWNYAFINSSHRGKLSQITARNRRTPRFHEILIFYVKMCNFKTGSHLNDGFRPKRETYETSKGCFKTNLPEKTF